VDRGAPLKGKLAIAGMCLRGEVHLCGLWRARIGPEGPAGSTVCEVSALWVILCAEVVVYGRSLVTPNLGLKQATQAK